MHLASRQIGLSVACILALFSVFATASADETKLKKAIELFSAGSYSDTIAAVEVIANQNSIMLPPS